MKSFSGQICVKTPTKLLCSSSPIVECGQAQAAALSDPYSHLPPRSDDLDDPAVFLAEVAKIVGSRPDILAGKGDGMLKAIKLLLHPDVKGDQPFVLMGLI